MTDKRKLEIATLALSEISNGQSNRDDMIAMANDALYIIGRDHLTEPGKMIGAVCEQPDGLLTRAKKTVPQMPPMLP